MAKTGLFVASAVGAQATATIGYTLAQSVLRLFQNHLDENKDPINQFIENGERVLMTDLALLAPAYAVFHLFFKRDLDKFYGKAEAIRRILRD